MTPRPYLSYSSINTLGDFSPKCIERWTEQYIYNKKFGMNRGMAFGKKMADGLENEETTGDEVLDTVMSLLPKFEIKDKILEDEKGKEVDYYDHDKNEVIKVTLPVLKSGKELIPILIKPDTLKADLTAFKEYKSSQTRWTKKQVDESVQLTWYAMGIYLKTGKIPNDIELDEVETTTNAEGRVEATGQIYRHHTTRSMGQILNMMVRAKKAWSIINKICEEELI